MTARHRHRTRAPLTMAGRVNGCAMLFTFLAGLLMMLRSWPSNTVYAAVLMVGILTVQRMAHSLPERYTGDRLVLALTLFLCSVGILQNYALTPPTVSTVTQTVDGIEQTVSKLSLGEGVNQAIQFLPALAAFFLTQAAVRLRPSFHRWRKALMALTAALLLMPLCFHYKYGLFHGFTIFFANVFRSPFNWVKLGPLPQFQPSEFAKVSYLFVLADCFADRRDRRSDWIGLGFAAVCVLLLAASSDLGTMLLYFGAAVFLYYAGTSNLPVMLAGVGMGAGMAVLLYKTVSKVRERVAIWRNPMRTAQTTGYQLVQGLMAIAAGGFTGQGFGLGKASVVPAASTDFIFVVICEQFGMVFGLSLIAVYLVLLWRGVSVAAQARRRFHALLSLGFVMMLALQAFLIIGGVVKFIPLTGVTLPFVSNGGSSLISCMAWVGAICGVAARNAEDLQGDLFLTQPGGEPEDDGDDGVYGSGEAPWDGADDGREEAYPE